MDNDTSDYQPVIGLEIHVELATKSKMFCGCKNDPFEAKKPNIYTCPVCLGLPGALPVPNKKAVEWTIMLGLALNCIIPEKSKFDRKHYFYPDLAKGFQISQYDMPLCKNGFIESRTKNSEFKKIRISRVHLEEDTGKLKHEIVEGEKVTLIDFNRSGVPLVEVVTEPDIRSGEEAKNFLQNLYKIIRYLGISEAEMSKGSMRLEPNISVNCKTQSSRGKSELDRQTLPNYKVEVKNINSFKFVEKAIDYEIERQITLLSKGQTPIQETRGFVESKGVTISQRSKEEAHDYRYFPEPDIPPIRWSKEEIESIRKKIPELPHEKTERFIKSYNLSEYNAKQLTDSKDRAEFFEKCVSLKQADTNEIANWIINKKIDIIKIKPNELIEKITWQVQKPSIPKKELESIIKKVLSENPKAVEDYKQGKEQALMFIIGQVKRTVKDSAQARDIRAMLIEII